MYVADVAPPGARTVKALLSKHRDLLRPNTQIGDENSCEQNQNSSFNSQQADAAFMAGGVIDFDDS